MPAQALTETKFNVGGRSHIALLLARSLKRPLFPADLKFMSPILFADRKVGDSVLKRLGQFGFLEKTEKGWMITPAGIVHLYKIAKRNHCVVS